MCLTLRAAPDNSKPYNKSCIRWKTAEQSRHYHPDGSFTRTGFQSPYRNTKVNMRGWNKAHVIDDQTGFHVFITRDDARNEAKQWRNTVILKIKVDGFLNSGIFVGAGGALRSETWRRYRVIK